MNTLFLICAAAVSNSIEVTLLKMTGDTLRQQAGILSTLKDTWLYVLIATSLYFLALLLTVKIFSLSTFSRAVPTYVGINIMCSLAIAILFFKESVTTSLVVGSALIIAGVAMIQSSAL